MQNAANTAHNGLAINALGTTDRFGQIGMAYYLNGNNAHLTIPSTAMQQVSAAFTVSIWAKSDTFAPSANGHEIMNDRSSFSWPYRFRLGYAYANNTVFSVDSAYFDRIAANGAIQRVGSQQPNFEGWEHYTFVYNVPTSGTATIIGYKNGQLIGSTSAPTPVPGARSINIGRAFFPGSPTSGLGFFKGSVDEVCLWNRALNAQEVFDLYSSCHFLPITPPQNVLVNLGDSAQFSVQAIGSGLNYIWQQNTGTGFMNLNTSASVAGINTPNLTFYNAQHSQNGNTVRCVIYDSTCLATSSSAILNVICPAVLLTQPQNTSSFIAGSASFSVSASAGSSFQWQRLVPQGFVNLSNFGQHSGVTSATVTVTGLTFSNNGNAYRCIVSSNQLCGDTSQTALLQVLCLQQITQGPANLQTTSGNTAQFNISAGNSTSFQWQVQGYLGFSNINNSTKFTGVNTSTLSVLNTALADDGLTFRCIASALGCSDTSQSAVLQVNCAALVTMQPRDSVSRVGSGAMFAVQLIPGATYQWFRNSGFNFVPVVDAGQYAGANGHQLYLSNLTLANHNSSFACVVSQAGCTDTSNVVLLSVIDNVSVAEQRENRVQLYPNPAKDQLTLVLGEGRLDYKVQVFDLLGKLQFEATLPGGKHTISLAEWTAGTYLLRVGDHSVRFVVLP